MKWSSHYIPIQAPMHESSIEIQSFENIHLVLFLDFQISLGMVNLQSCANKRFLREVTRVAVYCGNKDHKVYCLYRFKYLHSPTSSGKSPRLNNLEILP